MHEINNQQHGNQHDHDLDKESDLRHVDSALSQSEVLDTDSFDYTQQGNQDGKPNCNERMNEYEMDIDYDYGNINYE